jgi:hypothetical protein
MMRISGWWSLRGGSECKLAESHVSRALPIGLFTFVIRELMRSSRHLAEPDIAMAAVMTVTIHMT